MSASGILRRCSPNLPSRVCVRSARWLSECVLCEDASASGGSRARLAIRLRVVLEVTITEALHVAGGECLPIFDVSTHHRIGDRNKSKAFPTEANLSPGDDGMEQIYNVRRVTIPTKGIKAILASRN